jgi:hypothetical protein
MDNDERLEWISQVALAVRVMSFNAPLTYMKKINEFAEGIRLMARMGPEFLRNNKSYFEEMLNDAKRILAKMDGG